jgi:hypothetical protein
MFPLTGRNEDSLHDALGRICAGAGSPTIYPSGFRISVPFAHSRDTAPDNIARWVAEDHDASHRTEFGEILIATAAPIS